MATFDPVWATDPAAEVTVPSEGQIQLGFQCGAADLGVFNWLFQSLMSTINSLNIGDMASKFRRIDTADGLSGGGDLQADRTLRLDYTTLGTTTATANTDRLAFLRADGVHLTIARSDFVAGLGGGGGGITGAANIGTSGVGVFDSISGSNLQLRKIAAGDGVAVNLSGNSIVVSLADLGSELT